MSSNSRSMPMFHCWTSWRCVPLMWNQAIHCRYNPFRDPCWRAGFVSKWIARYDQENHRLRMTCELYNEPTRKKKKKKSQKENKPKKCTDRQTNKRANTNANRYNRVHSTTQHNTTQHMGQQQTHDARFPQYDCAEKKKFNFSRTVVGRWRSTVPETNHWTDTRFSTGTKYFPKGELWA